MYMYTDEELSISSSLVVAMNVLYPSFPSFISLLVTHAPSISPVSSMWHSRAVTIPPEAALARIFPSAA